MVIRSNNGGEIIKIGEFAKRFGIKKETVRFYTDRNLLTPIKFRTFYDYNKSCEEDMKTIIELKKMDFSLEEIAKYLSFYRVSTRKMLAMKEELLELFNNKIEDVDARMEELERARKQLSKRYREIEAFEEYTDGQEDDIGLPIEFINHLVCPDCGKKLEVKNGEISSNYIMKGRIKCECGYSAEIKEGILVFEGVSYENLFEEKPELLDHEEMLPPEYISAVTASAGWMQNKLSKETISGKTILDPNTQSGIMGNKLIDILMEKTADFTYIGIDPHFMLVKNFKKILSMNQKRPRAVFLSGKYDKLPLRFESCDYIACCFGLQSYGIYHKEFPVERLLSFLKPGGKWFETFFCVKDKRLIADDFREIDHIFHCESIKESLSKLDKVSFVDSGETTKKGEIGFYFKDEARVSFFSFVGMKHEKH